MRPNGRAPDELRPIRITRGFTRHAEGSVLVEFGETRVLVTASVEDGVPCADGVCIDGTCAWPGRGDPCGSDDDCSEGGEAPACVGGICDDLPTSGE